MHHLADEALRGAPSFWDVYPDLVRVVRGKRVVAYNAAFDRGILDHMCWRYNLPDLPIKRW